MPIAKILIKQIMSAPVVTVSMDASFSEVEEAFVTHQIRHLPVVDGSGKLRGLITKRDLYRTLAPRKSVDGDVQYSRDKILEAGGDFYMKESLDSYVLQNVMVKNVHTLSPENFVASAVGLMVKHKIGCVPVVDAQEKVCGIVTRYDVLKLLNRILGGE
jgi:CBS domain-containing protein